MFNIFFAFLRSLICKQNFRFSEKVTFVNGLVSRMKNVTCIFRAQNVLFLHVTFFLLETKPLTIVTFSKNQKIFWHIDDHKNAKKCWKKIVKNFLFSVENCQKRLNYPIFNNFSTFFQHIIFKFFAFLSSHFNAR